MVKLKYRKYEDVSNQREYNMLWMEPGVNFAYITWQTKYQQIAIY
jgi:hypothetical protein